QRGDLVRRLFIRKCRLQLLLPRGVRGEGDAGPRLAHGVDLQEVLGDVLDDLARAPAGTGPVRGPQPVQARSAFAAQVLLHAVEVFDRHEEPVTLGVLELEVLAVSALRLDQAHAFEAGDAVVDVDDQLVGREVERELSGQVLRPGPLAPAARWPPYATEQLRVGHDVQAERRLRAA